MVEGPQVVLKSKRITAGLLNRCLLRVQLLSTPASQLAALPDEAVGAQAAESNAPFLEFCGKKLEEVVIVGKEMFLVFGSCNHVIRLHFGMDGSERIAPSSTPIQEMLYKGCRKILTGKFFFENDLMFYTFDTNITVKAVSYMNSVVQRRHLDIMSPTFNVDAVVSLLQYCQREIYEAIMDQTLMPGVGNVIKCEGLFLSATNPACIAAEMSLDQLKTLVVALRRVAWAWYYSYPGTGGVRASKAAASKDIFECETPLPMIASVTAPLVKMIYLKNNCQRCQRAVTLIRSGAQRRITYYCSNCQPLPCAIPMQQRLQKMSIIPQQQQQQRDGDQRNDGAQHQCPQFHPPECRTNTVVLRSRSSLYLYDQSGEVVDHNHCDTAPVSCTFCNFSNMPGAAECEICSQPLRSNDSDAVTTIHADQETAISYKRDAQPSSVDVRAGDTESVMQSQFQCFYLTQPTCGCAAVGSKPTLQRVRKDGPNMHRLFWACCNKKKIPSKNKLNEPAPGKFVPNFDDITAPIPTGASSTGGGGRYRTSCGFFAWADTQFPRCPRCNSLSVLRRVLKPGPNNGKYFFSCPRTASSKKGTSSNSSNASNSNERPGTATAGQCTFFQWAESSNPFLGKENAAFQHGIVGIKRSLDQHAREASNETKFGLFSSPDIVVPL